MSLKFSKKLHHFALGAILFYILFLSGIFAMLQTLGYKEFNPNASIPLSYTTVKSICKYNFI